MQIYNKGKRDFIIARNDLLSGNVAEAHDAHGKKFAHITPDMQCEVTDEVAEQLIKNYPKEIIPFGGKKSKKKE